MRVIVGLGTIVWLAGCKTPPDSDKDTTPPDTDVPADTDLVVDTDTVDTETEDTDTRVPPPCDRDAAPTDLIGQVTALYLAPDRDFEGADLRLHAVFSAEIAGLNTEDPLSWMAAQG